MVLESKISRSFRDIMSGLFLHGRSASTKRQYVRVRSVRIGYLRGVDVVEGLNQVLLSRRALKVTDLEDVVYMNW